RRVYFNPNILKKYIPKEGKFPSSEVRRKSLDPNDFYSPDFQGAASYTINIDDNNNKFDLSGLTPEELYKYYFDYV
ncbi:uncharacterized protein B0T23DRAFT_306956, partial [Neurospora hispaniola]